MSGEPDPLREAMDAAREAMVREQLESRGIQDEKVLVMMRHVPRHLFVPEENRAEAYADSPLPIGHGQTISQPYIVAFMTEALDLRRSDRVLEAGTGSGYQTAVLSGLVAEVYTIEWVEALARDARARLEALGFRNVRFRTGDAHDGWPEEAPFDKIIVTAAPERIPKALVEQLKEGGKIIIPVGVGTQVLIKGEKHHEILEEDRTIPVRFVPLLKS